MKEYTIVPGRGLNSQSSIKQRIDHLANENIFIEKIQEHGLQLSEIRKNIESFVGSIEMPLGLVGPLLMNSLEKPEHVYCLAGTLEGALVASMNRGAKALSLSGGVNTAFVHQKMVRAPLFIFEKMNDSLIFCKWVDSHFSAIKKVAEQHSNHAKLLELTHFVTGRSVHLKFVFSTGDAAGQNMTTTCTWHAMLWIVEEFKKQTDVTIVHFVIEGNSSSDKKVSGYSINSGRGVHAVAECFLTEEVINKVLRTNSKDILKCFSTSIVASRLNGMIGYNINVSNAIAAIFVATGQDLGSVHESAVGVLNVEATEQGLYLSLNLPTLVIGTVGGGTHVSKQKEALELMGCYGKGKIQRFAQMIVAFSLALEISTYAAIVSGEFARAHEKLGRNKPIEWLTRAEMNTDFFKKYFTKELLNNDIIEVLPKNNMLIDNGILSSLSSRVSNKIIGFLCYEIVFQKQKEIPNLEFLVKSKPTDIETIKGLHTIAASIDSEMADLLIRHNLKLEYKNCHRKEPALFEYFYKKGIEITPKFYGKCFHTGREIFLLLQEILPQNEMLLMNTENEPHKWTKEIICKTIDAITLVHKHFILKENRNLFPEIEVFEAWEALPFYKKLIEIKFREEEFDDKRLMYQKMLHFADELKAESEKLDVERTIVHNDFNSRNIAVSKLGKIFVYDWELAVVSIPQRDIVEFLAFVLPQDFTAESFRFFLNYHFSLYNSTKEISHSWRFAFEYAIKEFLVCRVAFYDVVGILVKYEFTQRLLMNCFKMLKFLEEWEL